MKAKDLKQLSAQELEKKLRETREELVKLRVAKQAGQVENPSHLRALRQTIARIETFLKQKQNAAA